MADEEQKVEHINLKVAGQDGSVVQFKIKKVTTELRVILMLFLPAHSSAKIDAGILRSPGSPAQPCQIPF